MHTLNAGVFTVPDEVKANIGERTVVRVNIRNQTGQPLENLKLYLVGNGYWQADVADVELVKAFGSADVNLHFVPEEYLNVKDLQETFQLLLKRDGVLIKDVSLSHIFSTLNQGLRQKVPATARLNVLFAGPPGVGKSSMINTFLTAFSDRPDILSPSVVGGDAEHVTRCLSCFEVPNLRVSLYDMWGLTESIHKSNDLCELVNGKFPNGWHMAQSRNVPDPVRALRDATAAFRRAHAVIFFLPIAALHDDSECVHLKKLFDALKGMDLEPLVLLARADLEDENVRVNPFGKYERIEQAKLRANELLDVPPRYFYPAVPYREERHRVFDLDRLAYHILEEALRTATRFWEEIAEEAKTN